MRHTTSPTRTTLAATALAVVALLAACADDAPGTTAGSLSGDSVPGDSVPGDSVPGVDRPCEPVNEGLEPDATSTVDIAVIDYAFDRAEYTAEAGIVTFRVVNDGAAPHEVAFLPGGGDVPMRDGQPDEDALEAAGAFELEAFGPDQVCHATYELEPGTYTLFCIVPIDEDHTHYDEGMRATLVVT